MASRADAQYRTFDAAQVVIPGSLQYDMAAHVADMERRNFTADSCKNRRVNLLRFARWLDERGVQRTAAVTRPMIERYQRWLYAYRKADGAPLGTRSQVERVKLVQLFFAWATRKRLILANPASELDYPRPIKRLPAVLSHDDMAAILAVPDTATPTGLRDRCMIEVLYATGMRRMEIVKLQLDDLDLSGSIARIVQGKGQKDRLVPLGTRAVAWLQRWLDSGRSALHPGPDCRRVFLHDQGGPLTRDNLTIRLRRLMDTAGIDKPGSCHLFRHTMATHLLENGCDVRVIQDLLGHSKLDTTALYTHVAIDHLKAAQAAFHPALVGRKGLAAIAAPDDAAEDGPATGSAGPSAADPAV